MGSSASAQNSKPAASILRTRRTATESFVHRRGGRSGVGVLYAHAPTPPLIAFGLRLRHDPDDDAAILSGALAGVICCDRFVFTVRNHVHLMKRNLMLLMEVTLDTLGAS